MQNRAFTSIFHAFTALLCIFEEQILFLINLQKQFEMPRTAMKKTYELRG